MARFTVETEQSIPAEIVRQITHLNPSLRGHNPRMKGESIECGALTWQKVVLILEEAGVGGIEVCRHGNSPWDRPKVVYRRSKGEKGPRDSAGVSLIPESETIYTGAVEQPIQPIITPEVGEQERLRRSLYETTMGRLGDTGTVMSLALDFVVDNINQLLPGNSLHPCHLVRFEEEPKSRETTISLAPLDRLSPHLAEAVWGVVHAVERKKDVRGPEDRLETAVLDVMDDPGTLAMFTALTLRE